MTNKEPVHHHAETHRFEVTCEGRQSVVDYQLTGDRMIITHTFVPSELRGRGLAEELVRAALNYARAESLRVVPQCSYVDVFMRRHSEFASLRAG